MKSSLFLFCFFLTIKASLAQSEAFNPYLPPNTYRSASNPYYWKNRKPFSDYWQQDVSYQIHANLDEKTGIITGEESLTYYNNSPDTLPFVFFHLYQQAFVKNGHIEAL